MTRRSPESGYLQNGTSTPGLGFLAWAAGEAEQSPRFRAGVERLRRLAEGAGRAGYPRTTGLLTTHEWAQLEQALETASLPERPRAWQNTVLPTDDGLRHLRDYLRGCRELARRFLNNEQAAPFVHDLVGRSGYRLYPTPDIELGAAPGNGRASALAAYITGASWGNATTALRKRWNRARPQTAAGPAVPIQRERFEVLLDPTSII